jgi:hypothetical protein
LVFIDGSYNGMLHHMKGATPRMERSPTKSGRQ